MTDQTHPDRRDERMHELLGAFVLGGLDDEDQHAFTAHLRTCAVCQREAAALSGIPGLLDLVDPGTVTFDGSRTRRRLRMNKASTGRRGV